ncbi:MAG TPA: hypothetical protein VK644_03005 [Chitinophagaceae bacterium]|nr:hypothetical protein [Chitinophagaceae bacterium]
MPIRFRVNILLFTLYFSCLYKGAGQFIRPLFTNGSVINLFIDLLIIFLGIVSIPTASKRTVRGLFVLLIISTLTYLLNSGNKLDEHINGLRELLSIFMLLIIFSSLSKTGYLDDFTLRFRKFAMIFLVLQIPMAVYQVKQFGIGDRVGGTYGLYGGSGVLSLSIFLLIYFIIEYKGSDRPLMEKGKQLALLAVFLTPIFLNETKVSFLLIPLMVLTFTSIKQLGSSIALLLLAGGFFYFFSTQYSDQGEKVSNPITEIFSEDFLDSYLNGDVIIYEDVPRFTKIQIGVKHLSKDYRMLLFGQEYGAFKGGTTMKHSAFSDKYQWLLEGTIPYFFFLVISGGLSLIALLLFTLFGEMYAKLPEGQQKYSKGLMKFLTIVFFMMLFYNDAFRNQSFLIIFIYLIYFSRNHEPINEEEEEEEPQLEPVPQL